MVYGVHAGLSALLSDFLTPFGFDSVQCGIFGAIYVAVGLIGAFFFSWVLDKKRKYILSLRAVVFGSVAAWSCGYKVLPQQDFKISAISFGICGFFTLSILPVGYSFGVELSHPVAQPMANGIMTLFMQTSSLIVSLVGGYLLDNYDAINTLTFFICLFSTAALLTLFVKEDLRRINAENK